MSGHTPGPLVVDAHGGRVWIATRNQRDCAPVKENGGCAIAECFGSDAHENARRIVACVNACQQIDTNLLERITKNGGFGIHPVPQERIEELTQQRDELLAALKHARTLVIAADLGPSSKPAIAMYDAAIAKAEGAK